MTLIRLLGISLLLFFFTCSKSSQQVRLSEIEKEEISNFYPQYREYNELDSSTNYETNAVLCSFSGDHSKAVNFATKAATISSFYQTTLEFDSTQLKMIISKQNEIISSVNSSVEDRDFASNVIEAIGRTNNLKKEFKHKNLFPASKFIFDKSKSFHFVLINEAHYSSENRAFTESLLAPLWKNGYRYLALETLGTDDSLINNRGYPLKNSGYYLKESSYGNMVRKALQLGFKLVPYESIQASDNLRDSMQAVNIYNRTFKVDPLGKVIVHAGYGHISEMNGSTFKAMGFYLKRMIGQDLLSIDQQVMMDRYDERKLHPYYLFVKNNYDFDEPIVLLDEKGKSFVDPVNLFAVDIQVYHPKVKFINNHPLWLFTDKQLYELPKSFIKKYDGFLLQIVKKGEDLMATPVDQIVARKEATLLLTQGEYLILLIDKNGSLKGKVSAIAD